MYFEVWKKRKRYVLYIPKECASPESWAKTNIKYIKKGLLVVKWCFFFATM